MLSLLSTHKVVPRVNTTLSSPLDYGSPVPQATSVTGQPDISNREHVVSTSDRKTEMGGDPHFSSECVTGNLEQDLVLWRIAGTVHVGHSYGMEYSSSYTNNGVCK